MRIELEISHVAGIPILTLAPAAVERAPVIFFICGYGGRKEDGLGLGYKLARAGYVVVAFDPLAHGTRSGPAPGSVLLPEMGIDIAAHFFRVIAHCPQDVDRLLAHLADDTRVDDARCGVTGPSMGGYASFLTFAHLPQIKAAVPMIGLANFKQRWQDLLDETAISNPTWAQVLDRSRAYVEEQSRFIFALDPMERLKDAAPRALLIMNCDFDADQPKLYSLQAYRELQPFYAQQPDKLQLRIYPSGHELAPAMEADAVDWFRTHLPLRADMTPEEL